MKVPMHSNHTMTALLILALYLLLHFHQTPLCPFQLSGTFIMWTYPNFPAQFPKLPPSCPPISLRPSSFPALSPVHPSVLHLHPLPLFLLCICIPSSAPSGEAQVRPHFFLEALMPAPIL